MANVHSLDLPWATTTRGLRKAPPGSAEEALEVVVLWGESVLSVHHLSPPRAFLLGDGSAPCDFVVPEEFGVGARRELCDPEAPRNVSLGPLNFRCTLVKRDGTHFPSSDWDRETFTYFAASFASAFALVVALGSFAPPLGATDEEELDRNRLQTMLQILHTQAEREQLVRNEEGAAALPLSRAADGAQGAPAAMGKPNAISKGHVASNAAAAERNSTASRAELLEEARSFGLISMLSESHPGALFERDGALNPLDRNLSGSLFGIELGESPGDSGLGLSGSGRGSGRFGQSVDLAGLGTCQTPGGCKAGKDGFGRDTALGKSTHASGVPRVRQTGEIFKTGVLPSELVQRVVRQNFGRFRSCYEDGLRRNPSLTGRVTARFVIDRAGAVTMAQNGGSDLPDGAVVSCVLSAFYGLSFPAPDNGIVSVSYPILFSVG